MSTYLVAFIISNFTGRENNDKTFGVYARPDMYKQTEYAFNVGEQILKKMSEYLDSDYYENGMKKMHLVGMPDRGTGGMENWGLLTFHEEYLLYDEAATPSRAHQRVSCIKLNTK
jgi:aminopeptidase N